MEYRQISEQRPMALSSPYFLERGFNVYVCVCVKDVLWEFLELHSSRLQRCHLRWASTENPQEDYIENLWLELFSEIAKLSRVTAVFFCFSQCFLP
jgi:hypothetical protein